MIVSLGPFRNPVAIVAATVLAGSMLAPATAAQPSAPPSPDERAGGPIVQAVDEGVLKMISDGAGHVLFSSDSSITFDGDGRAVICCEPGREAGEEVEQIFRFGESGAIASVGPSIDVPYPRALRMDAGGTLWLADLAFDGEQWVSPAKRLYDADDFYYLPDGSVWGGLSSGRPTVARLSDGAWTKHTNKSGFPQMAGDWGEIAGIELTPDGSVWVAVRGMQPNKPGGVARFDGQAWQKQHPLENDQKARPEAIAIAPDDSLWVYLMGRGGTAFVRRFDGQSWNSPSEIDKVPPTLTADEFAPLFMEFGGDGRLWLTPRVDWECSELVSFDGLTWTSHMDGACVKYLAVAPDGAAWVSAQWDGDAGGGSGLYVIPPAGSDDYFPDATEVEKPRSEEEALLADSHLACVAGAPNADARAMCDLIGPLVVEAIQVAVDACGGSDPETDGQLMCLGFLAPILAASLQPPPWREGMDVAVAATYLRASAPFEVPPDEATIIEGLPDDEQSQAWAAAADRDESFASTVEGLDLPEAVDVLVVDNAERWRDLATAERALARDPTSRSVLGDYLRALTAAQAAESELRWVIGLPPRASTAMATMSELAFDRPDGPAVSGKPGSVLVAGRSRHAATRLQDGQILATGGFDTGPSSYPDLASVESFDPTRGRFSPAGQLKRARSGHWAVLLSDGQVLVLGGGMEPPNTDAELFDPASGSSKRVKGPKRLYQVDAISMLDDERVLVVGPTMDSAANAWLFDPSSASFTETGTPLEPRSEGTATLLDDGRVLLVGGIGDYFTNQAEVAELFDPTNGEFVTVGSPLHARSGHSATRLDDGRVLIVGGGSGMTYLAAAEIYDPTTESFTPTGSLEQPRAAHQAVLLDDGRVIVVGGSGTGMSDGLRAVEVYDLDTGRFSRIGWLGEPRDGETATLLDDGRVLVTGGGRAGGRTAEIFDPATGETMALTKPPKRGSIN